MSGISYKFWHYGWLQGDTGTSLRKNGFGGASCLVRFLDLLDSPSEEECK